MNGEHIEERAALYALGALDDQESAALEAHLRACPECAQAVGAAERDVALVASLQTLRQAPQELDGRIERLLQGATVHQMPPRRARVWPQLAAVAAALLVGILPSIYFWQQDRAMQGAIATQSAAMDRLAAAPHRSARFRTRGGNLAADVMYAPDGSWYVVLIKGVSQTLQVAWVHDGRQTMLGSATPHGGVAMLYLPKSHRMNQLALMQGEEIVAEAKLPY
jgi:anti-sigma factor RsiW